MTTTVLLTAFIILFTILIFIIGFRFSHDYLPTVCEGGGGTQVSSPSFSAGEEPKIVNNVVASPLPQATTAVSPSQTPAQSVLLDVPSYNQKELGYPLGCEIVSLAMMINYTTEAKIDDIYKKLPRAENPNEGFRGDPASSNNGWTIFPKALVPLAGEYLNDPQDMSGCEMEDIKEKLCADKPVIVWVVGLGWPVRCICLSGFDENGFYYNDPATGKKDVFISYSQFNEIWTKQIYDKKLEIPYPSRIAMSY